MDKIKIGDFKSIITSISSEHTAIAFGSGGLEVLATPKLVALLEEAAYLLLKESENESVGTKIDLNHVKATIVGAQVTAIAKISNIEGRKIDFEIVAYSNNEVIGEGIHTRFIIDPEKFMSKLK